MCSSSTGTRLMFRVVHGQRNQVASNVHPPAERTNLKGEEILKTSNRKGTVRKTTNGVNFWLGRCSRCTITTTITTTTPNRCVHTNRCTHTCVQVLKSFNACKQELAIDTPPSSRDPTTRNTNQTYNILVELYNRCTAAVPLLSTALYLYCRSRSLSIVKVRPGPATQRKNLQQSAHGRK